ncbi:uncharacterized protein [Haliotis cracherodii]|uniref:uncharacterized protein n=1 Tax=Haliotis cracherodii TaxID=6455 RepID=UPI0039E83DFA
MEYLLSSPFTFPVVSLLVVHFVAESHGGAACDSPYINNGRPVHIPAEEYAKYCCKANKYSTWTSTSRFDCAAEGGCCGDADKQYCCDRDKVALQLGLGITAGVLVILAIIAVSVFCCVKSFYTELGKEIYCHSCRCKTRNKQSSQSWNDFTYPLDNTGSASRIGRTSASISSTREHDTRPISTIYLTPTAPPKYVPEVEPDAPPPSYSEVIRNPHVFPRTEKGDATSCV